MATNYVQPGNTITLTAPSGGVVAWSPYKIGSLLVIATETVAQTLPFTAAVDGVFDITKVTAEPWTEGLRVYYDTGASKFTSVSTNNVLAGCAIAVAANPTTTGHIRLNGAAVWP